MLHFFYFSGKHGVGFTVVKTSATLIAVKVVTIFGGFTIKALQKEHKITALPRAILKSNLSFQLSFFCQRQSKQYFGFKVVFLPHPVDVYCRTKLKNKELHVYLK